MKKTFTFLIFIFFVLSCSNKHQKKTFIEDLNSKKAESFLGKNKDSAFYYFNKVTTSTKDSLQIAQSYSSMAAIQTDEGDYFGSQESLLTSLKFLNEKKSEDFFCLSSNYNELGLNSRNLKNYKAALSYYNLALKFAEDYRMRLSILNDMAAVYRDDKHYVKALKSYHDIIASKISDQIMYARILTNMSFTKWLYNSNYNAAPELLKALNIRIKENDLWGQNSSYAHLSDYYAIKQPQSALLYALKMYNVSKNLKSPDDQREALQKLIKLSSPEETKMYFETYQKLDDSIQTARNTAKNQFALIRYDAEKNKVDNLNLQKDNSEKKYQITTQRIIILSTFLLVIAGSVIVMLWSKKRKQRIELEAKNTIRENQLKTSKKVHDVVANGLYRVMAEIENQSNLDKERVLDKLEYMYEKSRDISYEELQFTEENFHEKITELLKSFATETTKVVFVGNTIDLWENLNAQAKYEIGHILQELMVNMKKHSGAKNVVVRFEQLNNHIHIHYTDDGIGISTEKRFKNGLTNTGNRIKSIHGAITFDTIAEKGLKILISFPIC